MTRGGSTGQPAWRHDLRWAGSRAGLAVEGAVYLTVASVSVRVLSARRTTRLLGRPVAPEVSPERIGASPQARLVGHAVERVAARLPWHPACLPQAIAARKMLWRRGIASEGHLGVVGTAPLCTHAWVTVGGAVVQGGPVEHATEVAVLR